MGFRLKISKEELIKLYIGRKLSIRQIAKLKSCSFSGIKGLLRKNQIPRRNKCESLNLCPNSFTQEEIDILHGSILGDGHITRKRGPNGECQFYSGHGLKQKEYLRWKYDKLHRFIGCKIYSLFHKINEKTHETVNFITRKSPLFTDLRKKFYKTMAYQELSNEQFGRQIPDDITEWMNLNVLTVWFMDDGCKPANAICTESFSKEDNIKLAEVLKLNFDIAPIVGPKRHKNAINQFMLYFKGQERLKLIEILRPQILSMFDYKLTYKS